MMEKTSFLTSFAGFSNECLCNCPNDEVISLKNIGRSILLTTIFSFVSSFFFLSSTGIIDAGIYLILFSALWAFSIFTIDRFSISIINNSDSTKKKLLKSAPRFILAICIAILIAAPVHVGVFHNDINEEIEEHRYKQISAINEAHRLEEKKINSQYEKSIENTEVKKNQSSDRYKLLEKRITETQEILQKSQDFIEKECSIQTISASESLPLRRECREKKGIKEQQQKLLNNLREEKNQWLLSWETIDNERHSYAEKRKKEDLNNISSRKIKQINEVNKPLSIFEKEEILVKKAQENVLLMLAFLAVIFVFFIIDFYPVIAKLTNPTYIYDLCNQDKKSSYHFKKNLSERIDKYTYMKDYNNKKSSINNNDAWIFGHNAEIEAFKDIHLHYNNSIREIAKEKIDKWSQKFKDSPIKNTSSLEKTFYKHFNQSILGKEYLHKETPIPLKAQMGFITIPFMVNLIIIITIIFLAVYFLTDTTTMNEFESILEIIVSMALLIEFFKLIINRIFVKS